MYVNSVTVHLIISDSNIINENGIIKCTVTELTCVDNVTTLLHNTQMNNQPTLADINIHLRARPQDREIIDQAAELVGSNRSQFMLASALKEAKNVLLDQSTIYMDAKNFKKVMDWMDKPATKTEAAGMKRLLQAKTPWQVD